MTGRTWPDGPGVVTFPDGTTVRGRALRRARPPGPDPHVGLYLLGRPPAPTGWECRWICWPDLRLPSDRDGAVAELASGARLATSRRVEVACQGGRGRTGTALAVMALACGVDRADVVSWVRTSYDRRAIETPWQRRWLQTVEIT